MEEIQLRIEKEERVLVTTLTKRMAEELAEYLLNNNVRCTYIHSDVDTLERVKIMDDLRQGVMTYLSGSTCFVRVSTFRKCLSSLFSMQTRRIPPLPPFVDTNCGTCRA